MLLKFDSDQNEVYLVEATGNNGVALSKWGHLRDHIGEKKFYNKCVFRHVEFNRSDEMVDSLEVFLREAVGLLYKLNVKKIMTRNTVKTVKSGEYVDGQERTMINGDRMFFCSELLAKAFKELNIIENDNTACSKFWPSSFSAKGE